MGYIIGYSQVLAVVSSVLEGGTFYLVTHWPWCEEGLSLYGPGAPSMKAA